MPETDLIHQTVTTITLNRYPEDQGRGHISTIGDIVGEAEQRAITDRELRPDEEAIALGLLSFLKAAGASDDTGVDGVLELFAELSNGLFMTFAGYTYGQLTGAEALRNLGSTYEAIEALIQLYTADPAKDFRNSLREQYEAGQ